MSALSAVPAPSWRPGAPRRAVTTRLVLIVGLLLTALLVAVLPRGAAQDVGSAQNVTETYYTENNECFVETKVATGLDGAGGARFVEAMNTMMSKLGHGATFSVNNGTVKAVATVECPVDGPSIQKIIFTNWILPAMAVAGGLAMVIAVALAATVMYEKIFQRGIQEGSVFAKSLTSLGGFMSTALLTYLTSGGNWQSTLSSAITAVFTTYLVAAYGFGGLQDKLKEWIAWVFTFAAQLAVGGVGQARGAMNDMRADAVEVVAQVRA